MDDENLDAEEIERYYRNRFVYLQTKMSYFKILH